MMRWESYKKDSPKDSPNTYPYLERRLDIMKYIDFTSAKDSVMNQLEEDEE